MELSAQDGRRAFSHWMRTGYWPVVRTADGVELKFNPYHDPRNGQFTFAPGGPRSPSNVIVSERGRAQFLRSASSPSNPVRPVSVEASDGPAAARLSDAVFVPSESDARLTPAQFSRGPMTRRGGNSRAFEDPMTLEQTFPGLRDAPGGAIVALANNIFDFMGPAREATRQLTLNWSNTLINQIKAIDPAYRLESLGFPETLQGQMNQLNRLRFDRAAAFMRLNGELRPLQVETLRFIQASADRAYDHGVERIESGKLKIRLSRQETLGNYIDQRVRVDLRRRYGQYGIDSSRKGPVRVNRRENDTSGSELTFRRPDARVGSIAYDVTLTQKTLKTPQVRGFFGADFTPAHVVIIRPRQVGPDSTYIITRPETKR